MSGTLTASNVQMVALDDSNNAAFAFVDGSNSCQIYTWANGVAAHNQTVSMVPQASYVDFSGDPQYVMAQIYETIPTGLLPSGEVYGQFADWLQILYAEDAPESPPVDYPDFFYGGDDPCRADFGFSSVSGTTNILGVTGSPNVTISSALATVGTWYYADGTSDELNWWDVAGHLITGATPDGRFCGIDYEAWQTLTSGPGNPGFGFVDGTQFPVTSNSCPIPTAIGDNGWGDIRGPPRLMALGRWEAGCRNGTPIFGRLKQIRTLYGTAAPSLIYRGIRLRLMDKVK